MSQIDQYKFDYQEVVEALLVKQGIKTGLWVLAVEFGIGASNMGTDEQSLKPAAIVPLLSIGLARSKTPSNLTVDASTLIPKSRSTTSKKKPASKKVAEKKPARA